jgi:hypothetical protein
VKIQILKTAAQRNLKLAMKTKMRAAARMELRGERWGR